jgi:hypothetical protein
MCECGGEMYEGECMECGYSEGEMEEGKKFPDLTGDGEVTYADILKGRGVKPKNSKFDKAIKKVNSISKKHGMEESDSDWDSTLMDGLEEETGKLSDIYNVEDLNSDAGFDYIEGGSNDVDTFEGMHKNLYREGMAYVIGSDGEPRSMKPSEKFRAFSPEDFEDDEEDMVDYENDDNEDDGFLDDQLDEQGGNADDMNVDSVEPGYDFKNKGPEQFGDDTYSIKADDMDLDDEEEWGAFDFTSGGPDDVYPVNEYETMESAFADEIDEVDVSGSQGIYGDMDPAYDFDSDGPGKGGPYQEFSYESEMDEEEEEWEEIDEDLQEDFKTQKNKIMEMFNRFNRYN